MCFELGYLSKIVVNILFFLIMMAFSRIPIIKFKKSASLFLLECQPSGPNITKLNQGWEKVNKLRLSL